MLKKTLQDETHTVPLPTYQRGYVLSILAKPKRDFQRARILGLPGPDLSASTEIIACLVETRSASFPICQILDPLALNLPKEIKSFPLYELF